MLKDLIDMAGRQARGRRTATIIPGVTISRSAACTPPAPDLCRPSALFVLQGAKSVQIGNRTLHYGPGSYCLYAVEAPAVSRLMVAPYLAVALAIDAGAVASLLIDSVPANGFERFTTSPIDDDLSDAWRRMLRLLDRPAEIPVFAGMIEREILFRLLQGTQGETLRQLARADSPVSRIRRAIAWIRSHYDQPIQVAHLAALAHMSQPSFYRHFKVATAMSPIQYQKQIRLMEARQLLLARPGDAAGAGFAVGYGSASQFSRDYARQFGTPPARDARRLRDDHRPLNTRRRSGLAPNS